MNAAVKHNWAAALLSGTYDQCREHERKWDPAFTRPSYCAFGVLGALCEWETRKQVFQPQFGELQSEFIANWDVLADWAGMASRAKYGDGPDGYLISQVTALNDSGASFKEIAYFIQSFDDDGA